MGQEISGDNSADSVRADIVGASVRVSIAVETGERLETADLE